VDVTTEEYLRDVSLGEPRRADGPIELVDHDPAWRDAYERLAARVRRALGARVLGLEHVGSTSVPGLCAKPIVDVVLEVADPAAEPDWLPALEREGLTLRVREPAWYEHRVLGRSETNDGAPPVNLHVFAVGCPEVARMVTFRDHLRRDAEDRELYDRTKRRLAARHWTFVQDYADAKSEVVLAILSRAGLGGDPCAAC
jgi:GrpB-like predicted nucleotidyltransferase (UPF0157 family)